MVSVRVSESVLLVFEMLNTVIQKESVFIMILLPFYLRCDEWITVGFLGSAGSCQQKQNMVHHGKARLTQKP